MFLILFSCLTSGPSTFNTATQIQSCNPCSAEMIYFQGLIRVFFMFLDWRNIQMYYIQVIGPKMLLRGQKLKFRIKNLRNWNNDLKKTSKNLWKSSELLRFAITTFLKDMKGLRTFFLKIPKIICVLTEITLYFMFYVVGSVCSHKINLLTNICVF